jgi:transcriptional regulator with XRE-family HTH domain
LAASLHQIADMEESVGIMLGRRLRELREAARLTQAELASLSLKSVETISNFERGKTVPSVITLASLARHLDCSMADLFTTVKSAPKSDDPLVSTISGKAKLLDERGRSLLQGFIDLLVTNSRR